MKEKSGLRIVMEKVFLFLISILFSFTVHAIDPSDDLLDVASVPCTPQLYEKLNSLDDFLVELDPAQSSPLWELENITTDTLDTLAIRLFYLHEQTGVELVSSAFPCPMGVLLTSEERTKIYESTKEGNTEIASLNKKFMRLFFKGYKGMRMNEQEETQSQEFLKNFYKISAKDHLLIGGIKDLGEALRDGLLKRKTTIGYNLQKKRKFRMDRKYKPVKIIPSLREQILEAIAERNAISSAHSTMPSE